MTGIERKLKDIQMFINETYSDKEPLQENQIKSKRVFNNYCNEISQDLDRLEKLEKAIEILKTYFDFAFDDTNICLIITSKLQCTCGKGTVNCIQTVENYRNLKEVLDNASK